MKRFFITIAAALLAVMPGFFPAASAAAASNSYVALGDSVAAGVGLPLSVNATSQDELCQRSISAYPYSFAQLNGLSLDHLACSGAKADEGIYDEQEIGSTEVPEQLAAAFQNGTPDVISLTVGANDVRWTYFVGHCLSSSDCDSRASTAAFNTLLLDLRAELNWTMYRIHRLSDGNPPTVLLNGYYMPYSGYECSDAPGLTADEYAWIDRRTQSLNNALRRLANRYTYVHYVPVDFTDHGLCSSDPWVQGRSDNAPFHPNAAGQQAIARANTDVYRQTLTTQEPEPFSLRERLMGFLDRLRD